MNKLIWWRLILEAAILLVLFTLFNFMTAPSGQTYQEILKAANQQHISRIPIAEIGSVIQFVGFLRASLAIIVIAIFALIGIDIITLRCVRKQRREDGYPK